MDLYVVTWFRREPLAVSRARSRWGTGWARGIAAFTTEASARAELERQRAEGLEHAGEGEPKRRVDHLGASSAELVAYTLAGPPTLELLAAVVSSPPRGDPGGTWDPLSQASGWWSSARVVASWWGGTEPEVRKARSGG